MHCRLRWFPRIAVPLAMLVALAGCGGHPSHHAARTQYNPSRYYPPPGSASDPWGPYIHEASGRFGVPERWVRRVMKQESGGQEDVISWAGAMGLMQVMPETYEGLRGRYNLGDDPFDPHNNILAGTAYLREMYDRYGSPGFLAAYNAGPGRVDRYLNNGTPLPAETVNYVASIAPQLGSDLPMSGPLAVYAGGTTRMAARPTPAECDPDAAYNPNGPCTPLRPAVVQQVAAPYCDPDAAYDPSRPCRPASVVAMPVYQPPPPRAPEYAMAARPIQESAVQPAAFKPWEPAGRWSVQVGAFANLGSAQSAAERARSAVPDLLGTAKIELPATTPFGNQTAFRARLFGLTQSAAADACSRLTSHGTACITVPPAQNSF